MVLPEAFIGEHPFTDRASTGKPDQKDLAIARRFGAEIKEKLLKNKNLSNMSELLVKGTAHIKKENQWGCYRKQMNDA